MLVGLVVAGLGAAVACGGDDATPGLRGECATFGGAGLECSNPPIESPADACQKLLDCGAIPLVNPSENPECCFDWQRCMTELERLDDFNREIVFACVEISSCDELKTDQSPDFPGRGEESLPLCRQHGNL
jgi:hypothetical protein